MYNEVIKQDEHLKISVVIPVFNAEKYLHRCLNSVINSTLKNIEIICVDDGSGDNSLSILNEYKSKDARIRVISQKHSYAGVARNAGLAVAKGEYIHFMDADDWIDETAYETWYQIAKDCNADVCDCMYYNVDIQTNVVLPAGDIIYKTRNEYLRITNLKKDLEHLAFGVVVPWNKIYLRKFLVDNNIHFDSLICAEDRSFYFSVIYSAERIVEIKETWIYHTVNNVSSIEGGDLRLANFDVQFRSFEFIWEHYKNAAINEKKAILDACIGSSIFFYRKSRGTKYENEIKEKMYNYWLQYLPFLGNRVFKSWWRNDYWSILKSIEIRKMEVVPINTEKKVRTIVFTFDENYVKYFSVALISLIEHANCDNYYEVIILYDNILEESQKALIQLLPCNFILRFVDVKEYAREVLGDLKLKVSSKQWPVSVFYRLLIPLLLPAYETVMYCDADVVFNGEFDNLFDTDFNGNLLGAVRDTILLAYLNNPMEIREKIVAFIKDNLGIQDLKSYFNAGILLFNMQAINREKYLDSLLKTFSFETLLLMDQDALNYIFKGKVKLLSQRYNFQPHLLNEGVNHFEDAATEYLIARENPIIVHYTTFKKPWLYPSNRLSHIFWSYARKSPFYEAIIFHSILKNNQQQEDKSLLFLQKYFTARIDIKNFGTEDNTVEIVDSTDRLARVQTPDWFKNTQGSGIVVQSTKKSIELLIKCIRNGKLEIKLRGMDCRDKNRKRYPVWIDYTFLKVDEETVFDNSHLVWHDKPYLYKKEVTDGQNIRVVIKWKALDSESVYLG